MTATEILRRLLDERGVEWMPVAWNPKRETFYHTPDGVGICADEYTDGVKIYTDVTIAPEQAIAATLGAGTCYNTQFAEMDERADKNHRMAVASVLYGGAFPEDEPAEFTCSACGETALIDWVTLYDICFCPFCGRRVKKATV